MQMHLKDPGLNLLNEEYSSMILFRFPPVPEIGTHQLISQHHGEQSRA